MEKNTITSPVVLYIAANHTAGFVSKSNPRYQ